MRTKKKRKTKRNGKTKTSKSIYIANVKTKENFGKLKKLSLIENRMKRLRYNLMTVCLNRPSTLL